MSVIKAKVNGQWQPIAPLTPANGDIVYDTGYTNEQIDAKLSAKAPASHEHNDKYYTESEIDAKLASLPVADSVVEVTDSISKASNDVVYVKNEKLSSLSSILASYERKRDKFTLYSINTNDSTSGNLSSDCTLIITPAGRNILVDIGRQTDYETIKSALLSAGALRLDYIFLSHYHHDHCGCTAGLTTSASANTSLSTLWNDSAIDTSKCVLILPYCPTISTLKSGEQSEVTHVKGSIDKLVSEKSIKTCIPTEGYCFNVDTAALGVAPTWSAALSSSDGAIIRAHNCSSTMFAKYNTASSDYNTYTYNNMSTVLEVEYGSTRATLTGDINVPAMTALLGRLKLSDVYKVPHHAYETTIYEPLLDSIQPRFMFVNADSDAIASRIDALKNGTVEYCRNNDIPMYLLAECGNCVWESNGREFVLTSNNRNRKFKAVTGDWNKIDNVNLTPTSTANSFVKATYTDLIDASEVVFVFKNYNLHIYNDGINTIHRVFYYFHNDTNATYDVHIDVYVDVTTGEVGVRQGIKASNAVYQTLSAILWR